MFDQHNLNQFVGANVAVKRKCDGTLADGKIISASLSSDETKIYAVVQFGDGEKRSYDIESLRFDDKSLMKKVVDFCTQMLEIKNREEEREKEIIIGDTRGKIDKDFHPEYISNRPIMSVKEIKNKFGVSQYFHEGKWSFRGINISYSGSSIVLISIIKIDEDIFVYHDHWTEDGHYIFSGEGQYGDQSQWLETNKAIINSKNNGTHLYLFVAANYKYIYQGEYELDKWSFEPDFDKKGMLRKEIKFRLKKVSK